LILDLRPRSHLDEWAIAYAQQLLQSPFRLGIACGISILGERMYHSLHSEISGCWVNSSRHLFNNTLSPILETNDVGRHTVELLNLFWNPRSSDACFDNFTCKWVTCQVFVSISTPFTAPRSKPPAQITNFPESLSKLTKIDHHSIISKSGI
jgi:hypothetical protein